MATELMVTKGGKTFAPASEGIHSAVLGAIVDKGMVQSEWGEKPQIMLVFIVDEIDEEGKPKLVFATYTRSLHEKARLYPVVKALTGKNPPEEMNLYDLIGVQTALVLEHKESKAGRLYANIASYMRLELAGKKPITIPDGWSFEPKAKADAPITNADIPF